ncbi:hypothetical protein GO755_29750 [Spirosoma sp. HMF4905]|uniref:Uncharacterized protein n=1 Tax=Spirosoma arboris TaxID=2682092 RepID=A0A7K1SKC8_9BACT|nr:hypothetical protein [Spirosoma arboris]MVM34252.1 hypothetical protein [Spirosoma arboris]
MPITLNHLRGENQIVQQVDFGTGDILILSCRDVDKDFENQIWLIQNEPKPKQDWAELKDPAYAEGIVTDQMPIKPTIVLAFSDRDSITSLIRSLHELYGKMPVPEGHLDPQKTDNRFLDEKGFVFLDAEKKPYWIRMWGGEPWLFYWHADNRWVSLRRTNQNEIWQASQARLSDEKAEVYHTLNASNHA